MSNQPDIKYLACLARLELTESEQERMKKELCEFAELTRVLDDFCETAKLDCKVTALENTFRQDISLEYVGQPLLSVSPSTKDGYITVPLTVKEGENDK